MDASNLHDGYYDGINFEEMSEDQYMQMPLRRKLLVELEDKLDVTIPAARRYSRQAYQEGSTYLTNDDLVAIVKGVLRKMGAEPRYPMVVLMDDEEGS